VVAIIIVSSKSMPVVNITLVGQLKVGWCRREGWDPIYLFNLATFWVCPNPGP